MVRPPAAPGSATSALAPTCVSLTSTCRITRLPRLSARQDAGRRRVDAGGALGERRVLCRDLQAALAVVGAHGEDVLAFPPGPLVPPDHRGERRQRLPQLGGLPRPAVHLHLHLGDAARYAHLLSQDGYDEVIELAMIQSDPRIVLAYAWNGQPLPPEHGFPLRVYVPDVYGMKPVSYTHLRA